jgi:hypothetical protein
VKGLLRGPDPVRCKARRAYREDRGPDIHASPVRLDLSIAALGIFLVLNLLQFCAERRPLPGESFFDLVALHDPTLPEVLARSPFAAPPQGVAEEWQ